MSRHCSAYDAVVVGAGAIGLACAWRAAERGLSVAVVDPQPRSGASYAAAGMLAPVTELHHGEERLLRLNLAGAERYPSFVAELEQVNGQSVAFRSCANASSPTEGRAHFATATASEAPS